MLRFLSLFILLSAQSLLVAEDTVQYGGDLNVGTVNVTLSALSWDPRDWVWKANHDAGAVREQLFVADLSKVDGTEASMVLFRKPTCQLIR